MRIATLMLLLCLARLGSAEDAVEFLSTKVLPQWNAVQASSTNWQSGYVCTSEGQPDLQVKYFHIDPSHDL